MDRTPHADGEGVCVVDAETRVLSCNQAFAGLIGASISDCIGRSCLDLLPWLWPQHDMQTPADAMVEEREVSGRRFRVSFTPMFAEGQSRRHSIMTVMDVTAWRRAETELRTTNQTLQALIEASPVSILALDLEMRVVLWNRASEQIFGWQAAEVLGRPYPLVPSQDLANFQVLFDRVIGGEGFTGVEARRLRKDGSLVDLGISTAPMYDAAGEVVAAMALLEDITERKHAERALADELEQHAALARENERLYREAQDAVHLREEFLSIASHELRTPCTSINLALQSLLRLASAQPIAGVPDGFAVRALQTAVRQGKHLTRLIEQLLEVSRIRAGRLSLHLADVDLTQVAREGLEAFRDQIAQAGCRLSLSADHPVIGRWDAMRLAQVLTNLVSNAIKYGAGSLIEVQVEERDGKGLLSVRDGGIGIPEDRLVDIFEPFERAVSSQNYGGLGLGLYIVQRIVDALGGSIRVHSAIGAGSTFTVELPCEGPSARSQPGEE